MTVPQLFSTADLRRLSVMWRRRRSTHIEPQLNVLRRRVATGVGAILLGVVALGFAKVGDWA